MQLYKLGLDGLTSLVHDKFRLERDIQNLIETNISEIFSLKFVASELTVANFRIDTLAFDEESGAFVIIEYKRGNSYSVIDQGYSYLSVMLNNKADFILEYNERMNTTLRRDDVDWSLSRVIFVSQSFNEYQKNSVNFKDIPFELWEIRRFEGGIVSFDQHNATSKESIEILTAATSDTAISQVSSELRSYEEEDHLSGTSSQVVELWEKLKDELTGWGDVSCKPMRHYIGFKKGSSLFAAVRFMKNHMMIDFSRGYLSAEGKESKNFFTLDDPKMLADHRNWTH